TGAGRGDARRDTEQDAYGDDLPRDGRSTGQLADRELTRQSERGSRVPGSGSAGAAARGGHPARRRALMKPGLEPRIIRVRSGLAVAQSAEIHGTLDEQQCDPRPVDGAEPLA